MNERKKDFLPLSNLPDDRVSFEVNFPEWVPTEKIGVNLKRLHKLYDLGGIAEVKVLASEENEVSKITPTIVGVDQQGRAFAGGIKSRVDVPTFSNHLSEPVLPFQPFGARWDFNVTYLNLDEMGERIKNDRKYQSVRSASGWADQLDKALRESADFVGSAHLTNLLPSEKDQVKKSWLINSAAILAFPSLMVAVTHSFNPVGFEFALPWIYFGNLLHNFFDRQMWHTLRRVLPEIRPPHGVDMTKYRKSIFWGPTYDRMIVLKTMARAQRVVKEIP